MACAAAIATLDVFEEEDVLGNVRARGTQARAALGALEAELPDVVADVRGRGRMVGVEFGDGHEGIAARVCQEAEARGLLLLTAGVHDTVRLLPPLTVSEADMAEALGVICASVRAAAGG